jgi:hypothetical protein
MNLEKEILCGKKIFLKKEEKRRVRHDDLVGRYYEKFKRLTKNYNLLKSHFEYSFRNKKGKYYNGEIDLLMIRENKVMIFEMKSEDNAKLRKKARKQLDRAKKYFPEKEVYTFYVTPNKIKFLK